MCEAEDPNKLGSSVPWRVHKASTVALQQSFEATTVMTVLYHFIILFGLFRVHFVCISCAFRMHFVCISCAFRVHFVCISCASGMFTVLIWSHPIK